MSSPGRAESKSQNFSLWPHFFPHSTLGAVRQCVNFFPLTSLQGTQHLSSFSLPGLCCYQNPTKLWHWSWSISMSSQGTAVPLHRAPQNQTRRNKSLGILRQTHWQNWRHLGRYLWVALIFWELHTHHVHQRLCQRTEPIFQQVGFVFPDYSQEVTFWTYKPGLRSLGVATRNAKENSVPPEGPVWARQEQLVPYQSSQIFMGQQTVFSPFLQWIPHCCYKEGGGSTQPSSSSYPRCCPLQDASENRENYFNMAKVTTISFNSLSERDWSQWWGEVSNLMRMRAFVIGTSFKKHPQFLAGKASQI